VNPNPNIENLKPFKKGKDERRNLKGAPPKLPELDALMAEVLGEENNGKSAALEILAAIRTKAKKGDVRAAESLLNRGYGLPTQKVQHSGNIVTQVIYKEQSGNDPLPE
jgi:hypothetical protein